MSHEIRTPLHAIMGFTDLLAKEPDRKERQSLLEVVRSSNKHLLSIVNDILDFSQIQAGQLVLERRDFELGDLVREIDEIARQLLTGSKVEFRTQYEVGEPLWLNGDRRRLLQGVLNLLSNAIKFTDDGFISLAVRVSGSVEGSRTLTIEVRDTGVGIAKEAIATILEPFSKERGRVEASRSGTGLGLAITHELVSIMQGTLRIESEPNRGSTFTISVNLAEAAEPTKRSDAGYKEAEASISALRVVIAEDVDSSRKYVRILLRQMGHEVIECANGAEAVRAVAEQDIDVVLMDVQMPVMDGLEATKAIRRMPSPKRDVYIAALTAQALESETAQALDAGVDVVLSKPFRKSDLVRILGQRFAGSESAGNQLIDA